MITAAIGASRVPRPLHSGQRSFGNGTASSGRLSVTSHTVPADQIGTRPPWLKRSRLDIMPANACRRSSQIPHGWLSRAWHPEPSRFLRTSGSALHSHLECSTRPSPGCPLRQHRCTGRRPAESPAVVRRSPSCRPWCCLHTDVVDGTRSWARGDHLTASESDHMSSGSAGAVADPEPTLVHQGGVGRLDVVHGIRKNLEM